jgi:cellulose biosynthesis protein BcsQ
MNNPLFFDPDRCRNETEVESKFVVQYLLPALGYDPYNWSQEVALGSIRLDFLVFTRQILPFRISSDSPLALIIEAKSPRDNLNSHVKKTIKYIRSLNVAYGVLTNAKDFRILGEKDKEIQTIFQCKGREVPDRFEEIKQLIGYHEIAQRKKTPIETGGSNDPDRVYNTETNFPNPLVESSKPIVIKEKQMKTIAVYHNKGGVGKTTTVVNLGAALARMDYRVLLIDLDSQANTTFATGLMKFTFSDEDYLEDKNFTRLLPFAEKNAKDKSNTKDVIITNASYSSARVDVIPSHISVAPKEAELQSRETGATAVRLGRRLNEVADEYDFVLIDCPPSLGLYSRIGLTTCDYLIIPSDLKPFANQGLRNVINFIAEINFFREEIKRNLITVLGILPSKVMTYPKFIQFTLPKLEEKVIQQYGLPMLESRIYERNDLAKALSNEIFEGNLVIPDPKSIFDYAPNSQSVSEFESLANEILHKIGIKK